MGFGNSQNAETARIAHRAKNVVEGPESCTRVLWRAVRPLECFGKAGRPIVSDIWKHKEA